MAVTVPADPEFLLAAACCRWPPSPERDAVIRERAASVDWTRFGRVVVRQRIAGSVDAALRAAAVTPPGDVATPIAQHAKRIVRQNMIATAETARLIRILSAAGYPVLAVKGAVLGALAYGSIALKHSKDVDLLILPEHIGAVIAMLEGDGYRLTSPAERLSPQQRDVLPRYGKDVTMVRGGAQRVEIELHWRLFGNPMLLPAVTATSPTQDVAMGSGIVVPTLADPDLYAYLVLHGAIDGWSRMKWIADVNALLAMRDATTVRAWHDGAIASGAGVASAQALILCHELFALLLDDDFLARLWATPHAQTLVDGAYRLMAPRDGSLEIADWPRGQRIALDMTRLLGRGPLYQWHIAKSVLYMQGDMYRSKIPPAWYAWYPLVRVPVWAGRRIAHVAMRLIRRDKIATVGAKS